MSRRLFGVKGALFALVALVACGWTFAGEKPGDQGALIKTIDKPVRIVFIPKVVHPWYDVVREGAEKAAGEMKERGITVDVKFDSPPQADINEHIRKIEANIGARPDGLAIACLDPNAEVQIVNDAVDAGLNVITFDTDAPDSRRLMYVGHSKDEQDGADLAERLAERIGGKGKVGILSGSLTAPNHANRVKGFKEAIAKYPGITIAFERPDNDDLQRAVELTENALQANPDLVGIFGCNASNPIGAARAVKSAGKAGEVVIVGMDDLEETLQLIQEGAIDSVKAQRQWEIGYWSVYYLVALNQNHTLPLEHATGSRLITKADL